MLFARLFTGPRVGGIIDLGEVLEIQVGVYLRGTDVGMAEQLLHGAQVAGGLQHVAGEGVTQHMRVQTLVQALADRTLAQALLDRAWVLNVGVSRKT